MRKASLLGAVVAALVAAVAAFGTGNALAYGHADQPVAQVEVSGNCNNATWCTANFGGLGGFWIWAELDSGGSVDGTFAGCGHTVGGGGPGSAGAGGGPVRGTWWTASNLFEAAIIDAAFPLGIALSSDGSPDLSVPYYVIDLPGGPGGDFIFAVPERVGHYNYSGLQFINGVPAGTQIPGVNFQTQVAP
jgi:hypothetical protein